MSNNITCIEDWRQWKQVCSYSGCDERVKSRLGKFGKLRLKRYLFGNHENVFEKDKKMLSSRLSSSGKAPVDGDNFVSNAWHLFDSRIAKKGINTGGKEWLAEGVTSLAMLEGRASRLFREVAREYVKEELGSKDDREARPLDAPFSGLDGVTPIDLLQGADPQPEDNIIAQELLLEVESKAKDFFETLDKCDKVGLLTIPLNLSIADSKIIELSGLGKSRLAERKKNLIHSFKEILAKVQDIERFAHDLEYGALNLLGIQAKKWMEKPENDYSSLFTKVDMDE